ncbi:MAG: hypothetical protein OXF79_21520 [Chloroflexi bacterium]|nr:hypothetical protein [Chloroflexota bacterium]
MPNFADQTILTGDNLGILHSIKSGSVDLNHPDPPFNSNRNRYAPRDDKLGTGESMQDLTLNPVEQTRLHVLNSILEHQIPVAQAAELLGVSERH